MKKAFKNINIIELIISIVFLAYGILAVYSVYVILPEKLNELFPVALCFGGFLLPFYAPIMYGEIRDPNTKNLANVCQA